MINNTDATSRDDGLKDDGWRMQYHNPTQDQCRQYISIIEAKFSLRTDLVWRDKSGKVQSLANIFPQKDGSSGAYPTIEAVDDLTDAEWLLPNSKALFNNWSYLISEQRKQKSHVLTKGTNITTLLNNSMSNGMRQKLLSDPAGRTAMIKLEDPLTLINLIMTTDFTVNTLNAKTDSQKYFQARDYFDTNVKQKPTENSREFSIRFNSEFSKVKLLATKAGTESQLPSEEILSF